MRRERRGRLAAEGWVLPVPLAPSVGGDRWVTLAHRTTGSDWPRGTQGGAGDRGMMSPRGPRGPDGYPTILDLSQWQAITISSTPGLKGLNSPVGTRSPRGDQGPQGDNGGVGIFGIKGPDGDIGRKGPRGPKGDKGPPGPPRDS